MNYGKRFKYYREKNDLSQKDAAKVLGVKGYQLANYECNRSEPNIKTLKAMSKLYKVSLDHLLGNNRFDHVFDDEELKMREKENQEFIEKIEKIFNEYVENHKNKEEK